VNKEDVVKEEEKDEEEEEEDFKDLMRRFSGCYLQMLCVEKC